MHFSFSLREQYLMINYVKIQSYIDVVTSSHNRWPCLPSMHLFERVKADNKNPQRSSHDKRLHYLKACYVVYWNKGIKRAVYFICFKLLCMSRYRDCPQNNECGLGTIQLHMVSDILWNSESLF